MKPKNPRSFPGTASYSGPSHSSSLTLVLGATASLFLGSAIPANAFDYLNDTFADLDRTNQALTASARWNLIGGTGAQQTGFTAASGALVLPATGGAVANQMAYFTLNGVPITLTNTGDVVSVSMEITLNTLSNSNDVFRIGLFNSGGIRLTADSGGLTSLTDGYTGYAVRLNPSNRLTATQDRPATSGAAQLFGGNVIQAGAAPTGGAALVAGTPFPVTFTLTKTATGVTIFSSINGGTRTFDDTAAPVYTSFDSVAVFNGSALTTPGPAPLITVDNVVVTSNIAPPPTPNAPMKWAVGSDDWDTVTTNWKLISNNAPVLFTNNSEVTFDDDNTGTSPIFVDLTDNRAPGPMTVTGTKNYTFTGSGITGAAASLNKSGLSTLTLTNANTYIGGTTLTAGTINLSNQNALSGSLLTLGGGSVVFDNNAGTAFTLGGLAGGAGYDLALENSSAAPIVLTVGNATSSTFTGVLSGDGSLVKNGGSTLTLNPSPANTYTGNTTINAGVIDMVNNTNALGASGTIELTSSTSTLRWGSANTIDLSNRLKLADGVTPILDVGGPLTFDTAPMLGVSKTGGFIKQGTGTLTLAWDSDFGGKVTIQTGTLSVSSLNSVATPVPAASSNLGKPSSVANGSIQFGNFFTNPVTLIYTGTGETTDRVIQMQGTTGGPIIDQSGPSGHLKFTSNVTAPGGGSKPLTLRGSEAGTGEIAGVIPNNSATNVTSVVKLGTGTWTLSGVNTYTGATTVNEGRLVGVTGSGSLGSALTVAAPLDKSATFATLVTDPTKQWSCASLTVNNLGNSSGLHFDFAANAPSTTLAPLKVTAAATFTTTPTITAFIAADKLAAGTYPLVTMASLAGVVTAPAATVSAGPRTTVTAHTNLTGTALELVVDSFVTTGPIRWTGGSGTWDVSNASNTIWQDSVPTAVFYQPLDTVVFDNTVGTGGVVTLDEVVAPVGITVSNPTAAYTITGSGSITGANGLTKSGAALLTLATANTYTGSTAISGGSIRLAHQNALHGSTLILNAGSGGISFDSAVTGNAFTLGGLTAATSGPGYDIALTNTTAEPVALTVGGNNGSGTYAGVLSGAGTLTKTGTGTLTLAGASPSYSGDTIVSGTGTTGSLVVAASNALGSGTLRLNANQTTFGRTFGVSGGITVGNPVVMDSTTGREEISFAAGANTLSGPLSITGSAANALNISADGGVGLLSTLSGGITAPTWPSTISLRGANEGLISTNPINAPLATFQIANNSAICVWTIATTSNSWALTQFSGATAAATARLGANNALPTTARVSWGATVTTLGKLDLAGFTQTVAGLEATGTVGVVTNSAAGNSTLTLAGLAADYIYNGGFTETSTGRINLTLNSAGRTQTLGGTTSHTGDTTVIDGTLSITPASAFANSSTVTIGTVAASPAVLNLATAGTDIVTALVIDGVSQAAGVYDSANSGGAITGLGKIQVGSAGDYDTWIALFPSITLPADKLPTADPDRDGLTNQQEYAFGLNPSSGSSVNPITLPLNRTTGKFSYTRRATPATTGLVYTVQTTQTLAAWATDATATQNVTGTVGEVQTVEVTLTGTLPLAANPLFVRVKAQ